MKKEIEKKREYTVSLSNVITQSSRHKFSLQEQKTLLYIVSMMKPNETDKREYVFSISDYIKVCGLQSSGTMYKDLKKCLLSLKQKAWWINIDQYTERTVSWLQSADINTNQGDVRIVIDENLMPYLVNLKEKFTEFELLNVLGLSSNYAVQLYQIFKSYEWVHKWEISVDDFKKKLSLNEISSYNHFGLIKKYVITPALKQINETTDIDVEYTDNGGRGKKTTKLVFFITPKDLAVYDKAKAKAHQKLNENVNEQDLEKELKSLPAEDKFIPIEDAEDIELPLDEEQENQKYKDENIRFLADACNQEFNEQEMICLFDVLKKVVPYRTDITSEKLALDRYDYLLEKYHIMDMHEPDSRLAYLLQMLISEIPNTAEF